MATFNIGSTFVNWNNVIYSEMEVCDDGIVMRFESERTSNEVLIPDATIDQVAAALRHGLRTCEVFDLMFFIEKVKTYRGEDDDNY